MSGAPLRRHIWQQGDPALRCRIWFSKGELPMKLTRARAVLAAGLLTAATTASAIVLTAGPASARPSQVVVPAGHGHGPARPARLDSVVASAHSDSHTLTLISKTVQVIAFAMPYSGSQDTDFNSKGKIIGFDEVHFKEFGALSGVGDVTFDVNGGFLYGKIATSNVLKGYTGKVTGGTGAFKGATGTIKTKTLNKKVTKQAVTITYST
jgi:hypothetical protein